MENEETVFEPRYSPLVNFTAIGLPLLFVGLLCAGANLISRVPALAWLLLLLIGIAAAISPYFFIRRIYFRDQLVVRRFLLPDRLIDYRQIVEINPTSLETQEGRVRLGRLQNLPELQDMIQRWRAAKILKAGQKKDEPDAPDLQTHALVPVRGYGSYGFMWALMFGIIGLFVQPAWVSLDAKWFFGIIFLATYVVFVYILPKKL
jgi:hypothetical protein